MTLTLRLLILALILTVSACAKKAPEPMPPAPQERAPEPAPLPRPEVTPAPVQPAEDESCAECEALNQGKSSEACFKLQPGKTIKVKKGKKTKTITTRCQPQSLIYARCRTGIMTCRLGDTSPVQWFACARKHKATTSTPKPGSVMVLDVNKRRGMPTGHPAYVEDATRNSDGTWTLRISHTNYDRKCHLDKDAKVIFYPNTMEASFMTGPWGAWAKKLKVRGFILR
ncbi:MAG: CHAP domain-containing protein [Deltaproteobacteria bacterium]|nr:CHAP domain-containing protein [Deltaproteobacteria bacterium]